MINFAKQPPTFGSPQETMGLTLLLVGLLIFSAFPVTAKPATWLGLLLLGVVWFAAYTSGQLYNFGLELLGQDSTQAQTLQSGQGGMWA